MASRYCRARSRSACSSSTYAGVPNRSAISESRQPPIRRSSPSIVADGGSSDRSAIGANSVPGNCDEAVSDDGVTVDETPTRLRGRPERLIRPRAARGPASPGAADLVRHRPPGDDRAAAAVAAGPPQPPVQRGDEAAGFAQAAVPLRCTGHPERTPQDDLEPAGLEVGRVERRLLHAAADDDRALREDQRGTPADEVALRRERAGRVRD